MPIRLPAGWKPPKEAQEHTRPKREPGVPDKYVQGWHPSRPTIPGRAYPLGPVHRWQRRDTARWLSRCGRERHLPGWRPNGDKRGKPCPWCWAHENEQD